MASKALIMVITSAAFGLAGCATTRPPATGEIKQNVVPRQALAREASRSEPAPPPPLPAPSPAPSGSAPKKSTPPRSAQVVSMVDADTSWIDYGSTFLVTRRNTGTVPAVPLFRQAIVVAAVRDAMAGLPAEPTAEFSSGSLTLNFTRGSPEEIAAAINRAIAVPEVLRLRVVLRG